MGPTKTATKNACIATAIVLLGFGLVGAPTAVEAQPVPETAEGTSSHRDDCYYIDPWSFPPVEINIWDCV